MWYINKMYLQKTIKACLIIPNYNLKYIIPYFDPAIQI